MTAAVLLHAAAVAALVLPTPDSRPASSLATLFTVALVPGRAAEHMPAKQEARKLPVASKHQLAPRHDAPPAAGTSPSAPVPASATDDSAATHGAATASGLITATDPSAAAGQQKTGVSIPAHYARGNRKPDYPLLARRLEEQGTVVLRVLVRDDGRAGKVVVRQSSGHELLDESARTAVEKWRFQPAYIGNVAVAEWYQVAIPFTLYN